LEDDEIYTDAEPSLEILYEDDWYLAVNKPAGIPVHPSAGHTSGTLANAIQWHYRSLGLSTKTRPGKQA
jgi:23S rRNA pseudouridine1911/1915/1917 synthase